MQRVSEPSAQAGAGRSAAGPQPGTRGASEAPRVLTSAPAAGLLLIGASTGAPRLHHRYLQRLPQDFAATVVIVQHLPAGPFIEGILRYLREQVPRPIKVADDGDPLLAGHVLIGRPGTQLRVAATRKTVCVAPTAGENQFAPSMDVTFASAARAFGARTAAAMISGLHAEFDGLAGCRAVRRAGGPVLVTTPATTPCYSMVAQVRAAGEFDVEAPLEEIGTALASVWKR